MINIQIGCNGKDVFDNFKKEKTTLNEVGIVLLRLKQIEHELINMEFESKFEMEE